jgi:hypothetical protein
MAMIFESDEIFMLCTNSTDFYAEEDEIFEKVESTFLKISSFFMKNG